MPGIVERNNHPFSCRSLGEESYDSQGIIGEHCLLAEHVLDPWIGDLLFGQRMLWTLGAVVEALRADGSI